jgi:hypothetical protein
MINPAKPEIKAARPRTYTTLWDTIKLEKRVSKKSSNFLDCRRTPTTIVGRLANGKMVHQLPIRSV